LMALVGAMVIARRAAREPGKRTMTVEPPSGVMR
jgi:hypothetical protein